MKKITLFILLSITVKYVAQTANWTKDDRNNLYSDCMSYATKYKSISNEQKESICLCYLEETTKKYIKSDFEAKIDIEIKRIKEAMLTQCAKNIGVDLAIAPPAKEEVVVEKKTETITSNVPTKEGLNGKWKTNDNAILEFQQSGKFTLKYLSYKHTSTGLIVDGLKSGDYFLDEKGTLTLVYNWCEDVGNFKEKIKCFSQTCEYNLASFSKEYMKLENITIAETAIQCNKIQ